MNYLRVHRALGRWPLLPSLAALCSHRDVRAWWRGLADDLTSPPEPLNGPKLDWGYSLRATPWATPDAVHTARRVLRDVAEDAVPLAGDRGQHEALSSLRYAGPLFRQLRREHAANGLRLDMPFMDDRVMEAALSARTEDRYNPWRFKPLLAEAMRGQVPEFILNRCTKGDYEEEVYNAQQQHLPDLVDLFADSALAARGVIDVDALRFSLHTPPGGDQEDLTPNVEMTIGCELWLRETTAVRTVTTTSHPAS